MTGPRCSPRMFQRAFRGAPPDQQNQFFGHLRAEERVDFWAVIRQQLEAERVEHVPGYRWGRPPMRVVPFEKAARTGRGWTGDDVLDSIAPPTYWQALTGEQVPANGVVRCPNPAHPDEHPSARCYPNPGQGWVCWVCGAGGTAIDLSALLTGKTPRGAEYHELRRFVAERLLGAAA
jgi:hypothetical protein